MLKHSSRMKYFLYYLCRRWRIILPLVVVGICSACEGEDRFMPDIRDYDRDALQTDNHSQGR